MHTPGIDNNQWLKEIANMRTVGWVSKLARLSAIYGLALLGLGVAGYASADCGAPSSSAPKSGAAPDGYSAGGGLRFQRVGFWQGGDDEDPAITGLWKFKFEANHNEVDAGYVTWHADGTELMNSGRAPMTGSFCMGVWRQIGHNTFRLNHYALAWDDSGKNFVALVNIREEVKVDRSGRSYSGTFVQTVTSPDGGTVFQQIKGTVSATRVTAD
jgi:hypothetical protein